MSAYINFYKWDIYVFQVPCYAVGLKSGAVCVVDQRTDSCNLTCPNASDYCIDCLKIHQDENYITSSNWNGKVFFCFSFYSLRSAWFWQNLCLFKTFFLELFFTVWLKDSLSWVLLYVLPLSSFQQINTLDLRMRKIVRSYEGHVNNSHDLQFHFDGREHFLYAGKHESCHVSPYCIL